MSELTSVPLTEVLGNPETEKADISKSWGEDLASTGANGAGAPEVVRTVESIQSAIARTRASRVQPMEDHPAPGVRFVGGSVKYHFFVIKPKPEAGSQRANFPHFK